MKVMLFGATGMVGQGVLRECLRDPEIESVLVVTRSPTGQQHEKLREIVHKDFLDFTAIERELWGYGACFFCLGVSSVGMTEEAYHRVTHDVTLAVARTLIDRNPGMVFVFVSGAGTDSSEKGRSMWARVKGKTENALLAMPFRSKYMFRPGYIQPRGGVVSRTKMLRAFYAVMKPLYPVWKRVFPKYVTTTEALGKAMIAVAARGYAKPVLETEDINAVAAGAGSAKPAV